MRKFKIILMSAVCFVVMALFVTEAFASVLVNLSITGDITYASDEIGADIFGVYSKTGKDAVSYTYLSVSGQGSTDEHGVYEINGSEDNYVTHVATVEPVTMWSSTDVLEFCVFIKNSGDRSIIPAVDLYAANEDVNIELHKYYFDISDGQTDFIEERREDPTEQEIMTQFQSLTEGSDYSICADNQSIAKEDVFMVKVMITIDNITPGTQYSSFIVNIELVSDIQYSNTNILTVRQENNIISSAWEKIGINRNLSATSIKAETNDLSKIVAAYQGRNTNADLSQINANLTYDCDQYDDQVVYKDIDLVNINIETGEIVGRLSDTNYDFEWYGNKVQFEAGTTLASGRTLTENEEFYVDVYTYYPTFYARRWVVMGTNQAGNSVPYTYISISSEPFAGSVEIPAYYIGTIEGTIFNPDGTVAHMGNDGGIILRSYVYGWPPTTGSQAGTSGSAKYLQDNFGFSTYGDSTASPTQQQYLNWQQNLTDAWSAFSLAHPGLNTVTRAAGENYRVFAYQLLYLVKYANNNSQAMVGSGNVNSRNGMSGSILNTTKAYNKAAQKSVSIGSGSDNSRWESTNGGGTIVLKGTSGSTTGTTTFNTFGLAFGYNNDGGNTPLYAPDFLTYNNGTKRILRDGYIGSDQYSSVSCLGRFNPWGNVATWVFGTTTLLKDSKLYCYVQFDDYDGTNYYTLKATTTEENLINNLGYAKLSYDLKTTKAYYRYCGTSSMMTDDPITNGRLTLVGLPTSESGTASVTTGICDSYWAPTTSVPCCGILIGGASHNTTDAGLFYTPVDQPPTATRGDYGFRAMLL